MADALGNSRGVDCALLIVRLSVGGLMLFHGVDKLQHGLAGIEGMLAAKGLPTALSYGVYVGEILAPVLLILGLWTRVAALVIAFDMFMAIFLARRGDVAKINPMSGGWAIELELLFLIGALALAFAGGGRFGLGKR